MSAPARKAPQFIAGISAAFGAFCLGASIGWSAPVQEDVQTGVAFDFELNNDEFGWAGSLLTLGAAFVCIPIGFLISWIGRKPTMLLLVPPYLVGWLLILFAKNLMMLCIGRFVLGVCGGAFCITAPLYTTEIAQLEVRGTMGSFFQLLIVHGVMFGFVVGPFVTVYNFTILCGIMPIIFFIFFVFMPESPLYYITKGETEKAAKSLAWLRGKDYDASAEIELMQITNNKIKENPVSLRKAMCRRITMKSMAISIGLMLFQQLTGINAIIFYSTSIFKEAKTGFSEAGSTLIIGVMMTVATYIGVFVVDKAGRRFLLLISICFMIISLGLMTVYFFLHDIEHESLDSIRWLPVSSICIFIVFFSVGFGPVPWLIMAEVFSEDVKGPAGSIAGTSNWLCAFVVTKIFPLLKVIIGSWGCFLIFTVIAIVGLVFILLLVPETKGKTLTQIQEELGG